jgi:hypothetical protein
MARSVPVNPVIPASLAPVRLLGARHRILVTPGMVNSIQVSRRIRVGHRIRASQLTRASHNIRDNQPTRASHSIRGSQPIPVSRAILVTRASILAHRCR